MNYQSFQPGGQNQNQVPHIPEQVSSPHKPFAKKFFMWLIAILLLASTAYGGIWWWQKLQMNQGIVLPMSAPVTGWKQYVNSKGDFSFEYPDSVKLLIDNYSKDLQTVQFVYGDNSYHIRSLYNVDSPSIEDAISVRDVQMMTKIDLGGGGDIGKYTKIQLAGENAYALNINDSDGFGTYVMHNKNIHSISFSGPVLIKIDPSSKKSIEQQRFENSVNQKVGIEDPIYQHILSTFKFIDSNSADTSTWKTYTNMQYGFTVKYPLDYRVNPYGAPIGAEAVRFVQRGLEGTDLPFFSIWVYASSLSPETWLKTAVASSVVGDMTYYRITTYTIGQRTIIDASPTELGTHARIFSEGGHIVMFTDVSGIVDPVPSAIQSFKFTK